MNDENSTSLPIIPFDTPHGQELLSQLSSPEVQRSVITFYTPQQHRNFCGVSSIITALMAHQQDGLSLRNTPSHLILSNQEALFTDSVELIRSLRQVRGEIEGDYPGLSLENLSDILAHFFNSVELHYGSSLDLEALLDLLQTCYLKRRMKMIVNFDASDFISGLGGHMATVAAIHPHEHMMFIADPAQHKTGWYWVSLEKLLLSMQKLRSGSAKSRGCVFVGA